MKKIILFVLIAISFSCNNKKVQSTDEGQIQIYKAKKPEKFVIEVTFKLDKGDNFRLFANNIFLNNTRTMSINITEEVSSSKDGRTLVFDLPEGIRPDYEVGINLGSDKIKKIQFIETKVSYGNVEFIATPYNIKEFFYLNQYVDYNPEDGVLQTKEIEGKHNPIMYLKKDVVDKLNY